MKALKRERARLSKSQNPQQVDFKKMDKVRTTKTEFWKLKKRGVSAKKPVVVKKETKKQKPEKEKKKKEKEPELEIIEDEPELEVIEDEPELEVIEDEPEIEEIDEELEDLYSYDEDLDDELDDDEDEETSE